MTKAATEYRYNRLTWPEMNDAIGMQKLIILPTGSTEQHGHHLPKLWDKDEMASSNGWTNCEPGRSNSVPTCTRI